MKKKAIITFILLFLGMYLFSYIPMELFNINYYNLSEKMKILYNFLCDIGFMIVIFIVFYKDIIKDIKIFIKDFGKIMNKSFRYYIIGLFFMYISNIVISSLFKNASANNDIAVRNMITMYPLYMLFSTGIYAPFVEEHIFRKSIRDLFPKDKNNMIIKYGYIIISGLFFALMHLFGNVNNSVDYLFIIPYMSMGIALAYSYYETDNIFSSITLHMMHNTVALIMFLWLGV